MTTKYTIALLCTLVAVTTSFNPYTYTVDPRPVTHDYTVRLTGGTHLSEDTILHDSVSPATYLKRSNKTHGFGYVIGLDDDHHNTNLQSSTDSPDIRSTTANFTYYFYLDNNNKYYIRDNRCNFVCVNQCGTVFTSEVRLRHHCKFNLVWRGSACGIYTVNKEGVVSKILQFDMEQNLLTALINTSVPVDGLPTPFTLKHGPKLMGNRCEALNKVSQRTLNTSKNKCVVDSILKEDVEDVVTDKRFYKLRMGNAFIDGDDLIFHKTELDQPNVYTFRNVHTCKFLCESSECGVFMSDRNGSECRVRVERSGSSYHIRFVGNNYYLSYNNSDSSMAFSHSTKSNIVFEETEYNDKLSCGGVSSGPIKKCGSSSLGNTLTINIPHLFLFLMLNYNRTMYDNDE
uniref:FGF n=1 Tax=Cydia pomonella granulosis virus TaxID=28289 RepID=A0A6B9I5T3_GVCP|nr:FGF [Cydia pomonella granulovirus]